MAERTLPDAASRQTAANALTRRESEVLPMLLAGLRDKEIAARVHLSVRTVKFHVSHVLRKMGCARRSELIMQDAGRAALGG